MLAVAVMLTVLALVYVYFVMMGDKDKEMQEL